MKCLGACLGFGLCLILTQWVAVPTHPAQTWLPIAQILPFPGPVAPTGSGVTVAFDATNKTSTTLGAVTSASFTLTLASNSNMGAVVGVAESVNASGALTVTVGGVAASLVAGTDSGTGANYRTRIYCVALGTATGAQTVSVSGMNSNDPVIGAVSFTGVNQTTPCAHGVHVDSNGSAASGAQSLAVTSATGNGVFWTGQEGDGSALTTPTQTQRWNLRNSFLLGGAGQTAAGASSVTGGWSLAGTTYYSISGVDIVHQ